MRLCLPFISLALGVANAEWETGYDGLFDRFDGTSLSSEWKVARRNWGGKVNGVEYNGGVLPDNVSVQNGNLVLYALGNNYTGPLKGINRNFCERADGKRVGGAVATERYFASGRYEMRAKIAPELGVFSAFWSFHYQEYYPGDPEYKDPPLGNPDYYAINHEINIEFPGRPTEAIANISFDRALLNTWIGENEVNVATPQLEPQDDGKFHLYRYDWHTGSPTEEKRVEFYVDNVLLRVVRDYVPTLAGRFWMGAWFPILFAGKPEFDTTSMVVDWVRITPFNEPSDDFSPEHFADYGWADSPESCEGGGNNTLPPMETFATANSETDNAFGGINGVAVDLEDGCGTRTLGNAGSSGTFDRQTSGGDNDSPYLRFNYEVVANTDCGYEYSSMYMVIGEAHRNMTMASGVRFYIRGTTTVTTILVSTASNSPCLQSKLGLSRRNEMKVDVFVTSSWEMLDVPFATMNNYKSACPFVENDIQNVGSLVFTFTNPGSGSIDVDNIEFY